MSEVKECPNCKSLAVFTYTSNTVTIDCDCGVVTADIMLEEDQHYVVYERFMNLKEEL